jgi:hypothetical protein
VGMGLLEDMQYVCVAHICMSVATSCYPLAFTIYGFNRFEVF